jgi:2-desacetyl-2-hydroxyethyl bacteriochlorophyllide A dehydrogenase
MLPDTMLGLAITELAKRAELRNFPMPQADADSIVIRTMYSCVSIGTEMWIASGKRKDYGEPPFIIGYQSTGVVVQVGEHVKNVQVGDYVALFGRSAHAQYMKGKNPVKLTAPEHAKHASMFVQPSVVANAYNFAHIQAGDVVYIAGQGFIGQCAAMLAKKHGAFVITSDISPQRLDISSTYCADWVIDASQGKPSEQILQRFPGGVDLGIESTGFSALIDDVMLSCKKQGQFVFLGWYPGDVQYNFHIPHTKQLTTYYPCALGPYKVQESVIRMIESGELPMNELISHDVHWSEVEKVYNQLFSPSRDAFNVIVIDWTSMV